MIIGGDGEDVVLYFGDQEVFGEEWKREGVEFEQAKEGILGYHRDV